MPPQVQQPQPQQQPPQPQQQPPTQPPLPPPDGLQQPPVSPYPLPPQPQPASLADNTMPKRRLPLWLKIIGFVVLALLVLMVVLYFIASAATKAPQKVSDLFVKDVQATNTGAAYSLTSARFKKATSESELSALIQGVGPLMQGQAKVTGHNIQTSTGVPQTAVLVYSINTSGGMVYVKTELQKSGNSWQVINFNTSSKPLDTSVE